MTNMKIGVVGLFSNENIGDYLLVESAKFLVKKHSPDVTIQDVDVDPREKNIYVGARRINLKLFALMNTYKPFLFNVIRLKRLQYYYELLMWEVKIGWLYKRAAQDVDCLIIAGGGFLKFRTQGLNYLDAILIKYAKRYNTPVMFNAVGIEGYDENDIRCRKLKKAINSNIVRVITTRDDIDTLQKKYITNKKIKTEQVGDPVFWLKDAFSVRKDEKSRKIGINLINPNNYIAYGGTAGYFTIENFYKNLLQELSMRDADFYLFTNGMAVDQKFGKKLLRKMNLPKKRLLHRPADSPEFLDQMSEFGAILAGRMHAGIVAYAMDIPKVGLIWSEKIEFLSTIIGERSTYFREEELDYKKIADLLCASIGTKVNVQKREELKKKTYSNLQRFLNEVATDLDSKK